MKRKLLPLTLMLIAGLVTVIITFIRGYSIIYKLVSLLIVFLIFYFIGSVIVYFLDHFDKVNADAARAAEAERVSGGNGDADGSAEQENG
jgi:uncharacterized BrkB/YihY/UPF0761 family membrane protein